MVVIVGKITGCTPKNELVEFINSGLKPRFFKSQGKITDINYLQIRTNNSFDSEFHGLVTIEPDAAAEKAINKLNGKSLNGVNVNVREYRIRNNPAPRFIERRRNLKVSFQY